MDSSRFEIGKAIREEVLGPKYISSEAAQRDEFLAPFYELTTEFVWGTLWAGKELDRKTRSLLDLAILGALGRTHGLAVHLDAALRMGCTKAEIREVMLHVAVFAGVAAGAEAFKTAKGVLDSREEPGR